MKKTHLFAAGAAYGILMRLLFVTKPFASTFDQAASGPMLASFVCLVPLLIGVHTIWRAEETAPGLGMVLFGPWLPTVSFTASKALLLIEGSICIVMALPIFLFMASIGGLLGLLLVKKFKPGNLPVHAMLLLPLLSGYAETHLPLPQRLEQSVASTHIGATPEKVWGLINYAVAIRPEEMRGGLAYAIGLPYPVEAITQPGPAGRVRKLRWEKNVSFDEPISAWEENRFIKWTYDFRPDSFPAGALDEHVVIGGRYFDLNDTSYRLTPEAGGTRLDIVVNYRVSTNFNWYSAWWGRILVDDAAATILRFYKGRAEA